MSQRDQPLTNLISIQIEHIQSDELFCKAHIKQHARAKQCIADRIKDNPLKSAKHKPVFIQAYNTTPS